MIRRFLIAIHAGTAGIILTLCASIVILTYNLALAVADFSGPDVSVLDGDTIEVLHNSPLNASASAASTARRKVKPSATERSRPLLISLSGTKSRSRLTATTSTSAPWPMCSCRMAPTSITSWSSKAGPGGIGGMHLETLNWRAWRRMHETPRRVCGLIHSLCRRGNGEICTGICLVVEMVLAG